MPKLPPQCGVPDRPKQSPEPERSLPRKSIPMKLPPVWSALSSYAEPVSAASFERTYRQRSRKNPRSRHPSAALLQFSRPMLMPVYHKTAQICPSFQATAKSSGNFSACRRSRHSRLPRVRPRALKPTARTSPPSSTRSTATS